MRAKPRGLAMERGRSFAMATAAMSVIRSGGGLAAGVSQGRRDSAERSSGCGTERDGVEVR